MQDKSDLIEEKISVGSLVKMRGSEKVFILLKYYSTEDYGGVKGGRNNACQIRALDNHFRNSVGGVTYSYKEYVTLAPDPFRDLINLALTKEETLVQ